MCGTHWERPTTQSSRIALSSFAPSDTSWRALLSADALLQNGHLVDAFVLYRSALDALPSMVNVHDSIALIYERTGQPQWAVTERARGRLRRDACAARKALCEFRLQRYRTSLDAALTSSDAESRYWRARAANELALSAFKQLDTLPIHRNAAAFARRCAGRGAIHGRGRPS